MNSFGLYEKIDGPEGYALGFKLEAKELERVKSLIEMQWRERLCEVAPEQRSTFEELGIEQYHEVSELVDHSTIWSKRCRMLSVRVVDEIREMPFFKKLRQELGEFFISDEDEVGWEEIYWRLVRPNEPSDVGPLHADKWFWDFCRGTLPSDKRRIKIWVAIVCERDRNGLCVVPTSHLREWKYHAEERYGMIKPQIDIIDENAQERNIQLISTDPGDAIIFNDSLLHRGIINVGQQTRVSLEFTMLVS